MAPDRLLYGTVAADKVSDRLRSLNSHSQRADVTRWLALLDDIGLDDITEARIHLQRAQELQAAVREHSSPRHRDAALVRGLASGQITTDHAAVALAEERQTVEAIRDPAQRAMLQRATDAALGLAVSALHDAGDRLIVELLRPFVEALLAEAAQLVEKLPSEVVDEDSAKRTGSGRLVATWFSLSELEVRWDQVHDAAHRLRNAGIIPTCGASRTEHSFSRPDLRHAWRVAHASYANRVGHAMSNAGLLAIMHVHGTTAPLNLAQIIRHPEWGPGILTAAEVDENLRSIGAIDAAELPIAGRYEPEAAA